MSELKIIQIQAMPDDAYWEGVMLGLGNDGVTYMFDSSVWSIYAPAIKLETEKGK